MKANTAKICAATLAAACLCRALPARAFWTDGGRGGGALEQLGLSADEKDRERALPPPELSFPEAFAEQAARISGRISGEGPDVQQGLSGSEDKSAAYTGRPGPSITEEPQKIDPELVGAASRIKKPEGWSPMPDYAALTLDGKLDMRIFVGYDEAGNDQRLFTSIRVSLGANGWRRIDKAGMPALFTKPLNIGGKTVTAAVKVSLGRFIEKPEEVLADDLKNGEVIIYNGHSTHGRGLMAGKDTTPASLFSQDNKSQILLIASCESEKYYEKQIRAATGARNPETLDILLTTRDLKLSEFVPRLVYSIEEGADFDNIARVLSAAHGSSFLWDGDTTPNDLIQDQITYDTRRGKPAALTPEAALWGLANGELHLHLRALPEKVEIPGPVVPADFPEYVKAGMENLWRRLIISGSANERTEWKRRLSNAIEELDKLLVNCKDNRAQFAWGSGVWNWDEKAGGVEGSPIYDELAGVKRKYEENLLSARDPGSLKKARNTLVPRWLNENKGRAYFP